MGWRLLRDEHLVDAVAIHVQNFESPLARPEIVAGLGMRRRCARTRPPTIVNPANPLGISRRFRVSQRSETGRAPSASQEDDQSTNSTQCCSWFERVIQQMAEAPREIASPEPRQFCKQGRSQS